MFIQVESTLWYFWEIIKHNHITIVGVCFWAPVRNFQCKKHNISPLSTKPCCNKLDKGGQSWPPEASQMIFRCIQSAFHDSMFAQKYWPVPKQYFPKHCSWQQHWFVLYKHCNVQQLKNHNSPYGRLDLFVLLTGLENAYASPYQSAAVSYGPYIFSWLDAVFILKYGKCRLALTFLCIWLIITFVVSLNVNQPSSTVTLTV